MTTTSKRSESLPESSRLVAVTAAEQPTLPPATTRPLDPQAGKIGWAILWLLGVPLPVLLAIYLIWGR